MFHLLVLILVTWLVKCWFNTFFIKACPLDEPRCIICPSCIINRPNYRKWEHFYIIRWKYKLWEQPFSDDPNFLRLLINRVFKGLPLKRGCITKCVKQMVLINRDCNAGNIYHRFVLANGYIWTIPLHALFTVPGFLLKENNWQRVRINSPKLKTQLFLCFRKIGVYMGAS